MRVINLTHGAGNGVDEACLMTATNMLLGRGELGDKEGDCICPVIRAFIIPTNDAMPKHLLGEIYGPLVWEIPGTKTDDVEVIRQRAYAFADWGLREVLPLYLDDEGVEKMRACPQVVDEETHANAYANAYEKAYANAAAYANAYANAYEKAYAYANAAAYAAAAANANPKVWPMCADIIRRVAAIGDKRPVECVLTHDQLAESLA